jgi:hypothetical protein
MKKFASLTLTIGLVILPIANTFAAWKELGSNPQMVVYVDPDTVMNQGEKPQIMSMLDLKKPGANPKTKEVVNSIIGINEYDCSTISYRPIEFKEFSGSKGTGKVVSDNKSPDSEFEPVVSESWAAGVFNLVCKRK